MTSHAGLDNYAFPGLPMLSAIASETNIVWVSMYLPSPSHADTSWCGQRTGILNLGPGPIAHLCRPADRWPRLRQRRPEQGTSDGYDAAAKMTAEGFPVGSCVYLDREEGGPYTEPQSGYTAAWCVALAARGFLPGVYCSHQIAADVAADNPTARIWAFKVPTIEPTRRLRRPDARSEAAAASGAVGWQRQQNVTISGNGFNLVVDLDVSTMADPSAP